MWSDTIAMVSPEESLSSSGSVAVGCVRSTVSTAKNTPAMGALNPAATPATHAN